MFDCARENKRALLWNPHYRTGNTLPKVTIKSSFCRKHIAKIYSASYLIKNDHFLL
jgi:hypothetical protein